MATKSSWSIPDPATIMTDPDLADKTYVEPLTLPYLEEIIRRERPDALLSTVGGQTGLNLSVELAEAGVLEKYGVELIGAKIDAIKKAEDAPSLQGRHAQDRPGDAAIPARQLHRRGLAFADRIGYPCILRASFTMGGTGAASPTTRKSSWRFWSAGLPSARCTKC